jgi:hypothetical protein
MQTEAGVILFQEFRLISESPTTWAEKFGIPLERLRQMCFTPTAWSEKESAIVADKLGGTPQMWSEAARRLHVHQASTSYPSAEYN